jgi:hypothetical protein
VSFYISGDTQLYDHDFVCGDMCVCVPRIHHIVGHETDLHEAIIKISGLLKKYKIIGIFCYGLQYVRGTCIFTSLTKDATSVGVDPSDTPNIEALD